MKKNLLCFFILTGIISYCKGQDPILWGMTRYGGDGGGTIFKMNGNTAKITKDFSFYFEQMATTSLIEANNGLLYGMTFDGGVNGYGMIYSFDTLNRNLVDLYDFSCDSDGYYPEGSLFQAKDSLLYGMTSEGGKYNEGIIFSYDINTGKENILHSFGNGTDGSSPWYGSLIQAGNGLLYGMTKSGGAYNHGIIFSYDITTGIETDIHDFGSSTDGQNPYGSLLQASDSLLYGMTNAGGVNYFGTIFSYNISTGIETDLHDFGKVSDGISPEAAFIQINDSLLYGTTDGGGTNGKGTIFDFNIKSGVETPLYNFGKGYNDAEAPFCTLVKSSNGLYYGTSSAGGTGNSGTLFSFNSATGKDSVLSSFGLGGLGLYGSLIQTSTGTFYGITQISYSPLGGTANGGTIFRYSYESGITSTVYSFNDNQNGQYPYGSLFKANNGLLYGITSEGGNYAQNGYLGGTIFSYNTTTGVETVLHDFGGTNDDGYSWGSLIQASDNLLYGMTPTTFFSYNISTGTETVIRDSGSTGGTLLQATNGLLYGMTSADGSNSAGTIFSYNSTTDTYKDLFNFSGNYGMGNTPNGSLIQASDGLLYGMTTQGFPASIIFSYNTTTDSLKVLHIFGVAAGDGYYPYGSLVQAGNGLLYGMTSKGGAYGYGVIFSYDISTDSETVLHSFGNALDGQTPYGSLIQASNGLLYGMTVGGGTSNNGVAFSYNISKNTYSVIHNFAFTEGALPYADFIEMDSVHLTPINPGICGGNSVLLTASGATSYTWSPSTGLSATTGTSVMASPTITTVYTITGTDTAGWISVRTDTVFVNFPSTPIVSLKGDTLTSNIITGNQWYYNDTLIVGATLQTYIFSKGTYTGYSDVVTSSVTGCHSLPGYATTNGINSLLFNHALITIYPNPTSNQLSVVSNNPINQITITDLLGQVVYKKSIAGSNTNPNSNLVIDVSAFATGMYFITVTAGDEVYTDKVVVTR